MTDFLMRLVQRANGQAPAIKPAVRSSYSSLPIINESANGFEETVNFEGIDPDTSQDGQPISRIPRTTAAMTDTEAPPSDAHSEVNKLLVKQAVSNQIIEQQARQRTDRQSSRRSSEDKAAPASKRNTENATTSSQRSVNRQKAAHAAPAISQRTSHTGNNIIQRKSISNTLVSEKIGLRQQGVFAQAEGRPTTTAHSNMIGEKGISNKEAPRRRMTTVAATPAVSHRNLNVSGDSMPKETRRDAVQAEAIQNNFETQAGKPAVPRESDLSAKSLSQNLVTLEREESVESNRRKNPGRQQFTAENVIKHAPDRSLERTAERVAFESESTPSTNIRVTIGRVEIRAIQPPERQAIRTPAVPKGPAVSLDTYLNGRDKEKR